MKRFFVFFIILLSICSFLFSGINMKNRSTKPDWIVIKAQQDINDEGKDSNEFDIYDTIYYDNSNENIKSGKLVRDTRFTLADGSEVLLKGGNSVSFYFNSFLQSGVLAEDTSFGSIGGFLAGTTIEFYPDGKFKRSFIPPEEARKIILIKYKSEPELEQNKSNFVPIPIKSLKESKAVVKNNFKNFTGQKIKPDNENNGNHIAGNHISENQHDSSFLTLKDLEDNIYYESGMIKSGKLLTDMNFQLSSGKTIKLKKETYVRFYSDGNLQRGVLAEDVSFGDFGFNPGTILEFYPDGNYKRALIMSLSDVLNVKINNRVYTFKNTGTYKNGNWFRLNKDTEYSGIIYKGNTILFVDTNENAQEGQLAKNQNINIIRDNNLSTYTFRAGTMIDYYSNGNVASGTLNNDQNVNLIFDDNKTSVKFKNGCIISFYPDGNVKKGTIAFSTEINGITFPAGSEIYFDSYGNTRLVRPFSDVMISGIKYKGSSQASDQNVMLFYNNNQMQMAILSGDQKINIVKDNNDNAVLFKNETYIEFYENGNVKNGIIALDTEIKNQVYPGGTYIEFDKDGQITEADQPKKDDNSNPAQ